MAYVPDVKGVLPQALNRVNTIYAANAYNEEPIRANRIYVAPPDFHLLLEKGKLRLTRGPKENRFRPAVDPLFRSAAYHYGNHVIGIVLSGGLDDGTAGLWTIKHHGGIAIVQNPLDAEVPSMPESALREVEVDHNVGVAGLAKLLVRLSKEPLPEKSTNMKDEQTKKEIEIAAEENALKRNILSFGELSPFTCPECHGVLSRLHNGGIIRYRCHTGHAYTVNSLLNALTETTEESLYSAMRALDESIMLLNHIGDHFAEMNEPALAAVYFQKAQETDGRKQLVRNATLSHEQLSMEALLKEVENEKKKTEK